MVEVDIHCPYCGSQNFETLGPGSLLRKDAPRLSQIEIGDKDTLYRCLDRHCGGVFGTCTFRRYPILEGKMGVGKAQLSV